MADKTKIIGKAAAAASPGAKLVKTLADLRNNKKKADFQKGDYSDINIKGIINPKKSGILKIKVTETTALKTNLEA